MPFKEKHREWHDVINAGRRTDWGLERRTLGFVPGRVDDRPGHPPGRELRNLANLIAGRRVKRVWLDERMESFAKYRELGLHQTDARVVVVAGHDRFWNHSPEFVASLYGDRFEAMLLDNWYERYSRLPFKVRRIGWSCNFDHYWERPAISPPKDIDISFIGYNSHPDRARYVDLIRRKFPNLDLHLMLETEPDAFSNFVPKSEYFDIIQRSRIALNLRGAADRGKTMRAYEIPYVGSFMLSQRIDDPGMAEDFQDGVHCLYFDDESSLIQSISWALVNQPFNYREQIAAQGHQRALNELSVQRRWADVLQWLRGHEHIQGSV